MSFRVVNGGAVRFEKFKIDFPMDLIERIMEYLNENKDILSLALSSDKIFKAFRIEEFFLKKALDLSFEEIQSFPFKKICKIYLKNLYVVNKKGKKYEAKAKGKKHFQNVAVLNSHFGNLKGFVDLKKIKIFSFFRKNIEAYQMPFLEKLSSLNALICQRETFLFSNCQDIDVSLKCVYLFKRYCSKKDFRNYSFYFPLCSLKNMKTIYLETSSEDFEKVFRRRIF